MKTVFSNMFLKKVLLKGSLLGLAGIISFPVFASNAYSLEEVYSFKRQNIDVRVFKDARGLALKVTNPNISNVDKFSLPNPSRIIFDITGVKVTNSEFVTIPGVPFIKDIRMGAKPPQQTRMVIDINGSKIPAFNADKSQGEFTIYLANTAGDIEALRNGNGENIPQNVPAPNNNNQEVVQGGEAEVNIIDATIVDENQNQDTGNTAGKLDSEIKKVESAKPNIKKEEPKKEEPKKEVVAPTNTPTPLPTATPIPAETKIEVDNVINPDVNNNPQEAQNNNGQNEQVNIDGGVANNEGCSLNSITFDMDVTGSAIAKIKLNKKVNFSIKTASPELYKVLIPTCKLASKNMVLPFFPPPEYKKFVFIQAKEMGNDVEVSIGIESNARLNYLPRNEEIWIKPQM